MQWSETTTQQCKKDSLCLSGVFLSGKLFELSIILVIKYLKPAMLYIVFFLCFFIYLFICFVLLCISCYDQIVMICFLISAVPKLGPAHWARITWNFCLFALGTVPSVQSSCSSLKPNSSVPNNEGDQQCADSCPDPYRSSYISAPACINRLVQFGVRTSFLWSPCQHWAAILWGAVR